ncbi:MAG TPA: hypothetical protein ENI57_09070 [Ignavibacteria bacterium]|nr:hypothetical protein [Ignavibacteria bacterium]
MIKEEIKSKQIDLLVEEFWRLGYLTISRKLGTYLPEPQKVGKYSVDVIARYNKNPAIGLTLDDEDVNRTDLMEMINFLATRKTRYTNKRVMLFLGVVPDHYQKIRILLSSLEDDVRKNIKLFNLNERQVSHRHLSKMQTRLFVS